MTGRDSRDESDAAFAGRSVATSLQPGHRLDLTPGLTVAVVLGATATGKTSLAVKMAHALGGEIMSADSRYFYRGMDIGTAKPSADEMEGVPHHLIDILDPQETYSLAKFIDDAYLAIETIAARGHLPIVAGGTPQYLRALIEGWIVPRIEPDQALRAKFDAEDTADLSKRLRDLDPIAADQIGTTNRRRIIRALEVIETSGQRLSDQRRRTPPPWRWCIVGLEQARALLYERIDARVRAMYAAGWLDEVRALKARGVDASSPSMTAHGYREALAVVNGELDTEQAIARTCTMIHRYVRHQSTWFRRFEDVTWFDSSRPDYQDSAIAWVRRCVAGRSSIE